MEFHFIYKNKILFIKEQSKKHPLISSFKINILYLFSFALILIILLMLYPFFKNLVILNNKKLINNEINEILNNINKNIILCQKGILVNDILKSTSNPIITIIISIYNSEKTIRAAIRSVQNQNFRDIEILLIDDCSKDNSLSIIKQLQQEDLRIKIIKNKINRGPLFSKSIAALNSRGKYTILLDSDDLFVNFNLFDICYKEAVNNNIDIIEFSGFEIYNKLLRIQGKLPAIPLYLKYKKNKVIVRQPQLSNYMFNKDKGRYNQIDGYLWGKLIKTTIYTNSLKIVSKHIYYLKLYYGDDRLVNFILLKVANSFKFLEIYGIIYYYNRYSITKSFKKYRNCYDELRYIKFLYDFTKNSDESEIVVKEIFIRLNWTLRPGLYKSNMNYFIFILMEILKGKYISKYNKNKVFNLIKKFNPKIIKINDSFID
jgi:glycosyltransferase involved in cell wall biosynthesis